MDRGYIKLFRRLSESDLWLSEPFTRGQAWVDLVLLANHKPGFIRVRGVRVELKRGQVGWSEVKLAARWRWSRGKVKRFLNELETLQQIEQQKNNVTSLIYITKYETYQINSTANSTANGQQTDSKQDTNKNEKNEKNIYTPLKNFLISKIQNGFTPHTEKIIEFFEYRMAKPKRDQYQTEKGIDGLFRDMDACKKLGYALGDCLDIAMEKGWQTPCPDYFKNIPSIISQTSQPTQSMYREL